MPAADPHWVLIEAYVATRRRTHGRDAEAAGLAAAGAVHSAVLRGRRH